MGNLRGVILAGGMGSRLLPLTKVINKCLLPVYNKMLIEHAVDVLKQFDIQDIMVILGGNSVGQVMQALGDGNEYGVSFAYRIQKAPIGISHGLGMAADFVGNNHVALILGDNIFFDKFESVKGPLIFLKEVQDPRRFGCPKFKDEIIEEIIEKPEEPPSKYAVAGLYIYPPSAFDIIPTLKPSARGELEITDLNNAYARMGILKYKILEKAWIDTGTIESLYKANVLMKEKEKK
jgi:glucose-1-phosphate thymidylyltransferase